MSADGSSPGKARPPVTDWATDWDHFDPAWNKNPFPIWADLRANGCPIASTKRYMGAHAPLTYEAVKAIAYDTTHFSSRRVVVRDSRPEPVQPAPPITSDPPAHKPLKQILLPPFTPEEMTKLEPKARAICNDLIDQFIKQGRCDAAQDYARHIPVRVIAHMLGVPQSDGDKFVDWIHRILELGVHDDAVSMAARDEMQAYIVAQFEARQRYPTDDLITRIAHSKFMGQPIPPQLAVGMVLLLLIAGIDTTWSAIGASLWHLAKTPEDRDRLVAQPALMPTAIEEFLRAYAPVTMAREVVKETSVAGCPMKPGEMILLSFPAANRDPAMFPDADKVIIDRKENRHAAFGLGIHRCVGSNLARMEMTVAVEEWLKRIPKFSLEAGKETTWSEGTVRGPRHMPVVFA
jgi:cytochrome P450